MFSWSNSCNKTNRKMSVKCRVQITTGRRGLVSQNKWKRLCGGVTDCVVDWQKAWIAFHIISPWYTCSQELCIHLYSYLKLLLIAVHLSLLSLCHLCYLILIGNQWCTRLLNAGTEGPSCLKQNQGCISYSLYLQGLPLPWVLCTATVCSAAPSSSSLTFQAQPQGINCWWELSLCGPGSLH